MNMSEPQWPVELYRCTEFDGWQKQQTQGDALLFASPRKDSIVLPALRQKFTLRGENDRDKSSVIRRNNCILLVSRKRTRAMMLKFASLKDCLDFSDRFCEINHPSFADTNKDDLAAKESRHRRTIDPSHDHAVAEEYHNDQTAESQPTSVRIEDQEQVLSHIVQLVHNPEFMEFVHKLENYIGSCTDGAKLLQALEVAPNQEELTIGTNSNNTDDSQEI